MSVLQSFAMSLQRLTLSSCAFAICFVILNYHDCTATKSKGTKDLHFQDIKFIVLSQSNEFHAAEAAKFKENFQNQLTKLNQDDQPELLFTHEDLVDLRGSWTVFPLIEQLVEKQNRKDFAWVFICEEDTQVQISELRDLLQQYDATQNWFLGRELHDDQTTIIHHFAFMDNPRQFAYPDFRAGFVMSMELVKQIHKRLQTDKLKTDFSIDPKHEFALFIWNEGKGTKLTHVKQFCSADESSKSHCITSQPGKFPDCGEPIDKEDLFVAVKTCQQFHNSRIPIVKATWGKEAKLIEYFSEKADKSIPTIDLGVPNTERGHCGKTMAIIKRIINTPNLSAVSWVLIADDDTIINLDRLRSLLACYNSRQPVALGERYGYGVVRSGGYDYITGGGGMVFSQPALILLSEKCRCYSDNAPDDMTLGMCLKSIGIPLTHSRFFHQARPDDYSVDFLSNQLPVSFHKHWNNDPYKVYADLIGSSKTKKDRKPSGKSKDDKKDEL